MMFKNCIVRNIVGLEMVANFVVSIEGHHETNAECKVREKAASNRNQFDIIRDCLFGGTINCSHDWQVRGAPRRVQNSRIQGIRDGIPGVCQIKC